MRDDAHALPPLISHGLLRLLNIKKQLMASIDPANIKSALECCPNHFNCGTEETDEASMPPNPSITRKLGIAQHISVDREEKSDRYETSPDLNEERLGSFIIQ